MQITPSVVDELAAWNNGAGIDLAAWVGCAGRFGLAVGYAGIFWPNFALFDGYVLRDGFNEASLRAFASQDSSTRQSVERVMNHLHIAVIQHYGCEDISKDKLRLLGQVLAEIFAVTLRWQFPDRRCEVEFHIPADEDDLMEYQVSFWQADLAADVP